MNKAKYNFEDVKLFLKQHYGLDWNGEIYDTNNRVKRQAEETDIKGDYNLFSAFVPVLKGNVKLNVIIEVADIYFGVISEDEQLGPKTELWLKCLASKESTQTV